MIKTYENGDLFLKENKEYLDTNPYQAVFFYYDAPLLKKPNENNYALKITNDNKTLLALNVEPYHLMLFGNNECSSDLVDYLIQNKMNFNSMLGSEDVCNEIVKHSSNFNIHFEEHLAMDFMEAKEITEPSSNEIEIPKTEDIDELYDLNQYFLKECKLFDKVTKEDIIKRINDYRILKKDNKIISIARISKGTSIDDRITCVYTRDEYRNTGIARKVVNTCKNEILNKGLYATLNVDKKNPISNHLYSSLGFKKIFSQGEYRRID